MTGHAGGRFASVATLLAALALGACVGRAYPPAQTAWQTPKDPAPIPRRKPLPPTGFLAAFPVGAEVASSNFVVAVLPVQNAPVKNAPVIKAAVTTVSLESAAAQNPQVQAAPEPRPATTPNPTIPASPAAAQDIYNRTYSVVRGDSLYAIARRFGLPVERLLKINGLQPPYSLTVGQQLRLPGPRTYLVRSGDTIYSIARAQGVDLTALVYENKIRRPYVITSGQNLVLPPQPGSATRLAQAGRPAAGQPVARTPITRVTASTAQKGAARTQQVAVVAQPTVKSDPVKTLPPKVKPRKAGALPAPPPRQGKKFIWPVQGKISSPYGPHRGGLYNDGINIAAPRGTPVQAADSGVVAYADTGLEGFGRLVLIKHAGGWVTAYAHNEKLLVQRGDTVQRGQVIATVGTSGNVGRPQLHFEIRKGTRPINPAPHLARQGTASKP